MFSPTTLSLLRFCPVCLSSQVSSCSRPSMKIGRPFLQYSPTISACAAPERHVDEGHLFALLAALGGVHAVHGQADVGDRRAFRRVFDLGVPGEIPDQHDLVEIRHGSSRVERSGQRGLRLALLSLLGASFW